MECPVTKGRGGTLFAAEKPVCSCGLHPCFIPAPAVQSTEPVATTNAASASTTFTPVPGVRNPYLKSNNQNSSSQQHNNYRKIPTVRAIRHFTRNQSPNRLQLNAGSQPS
eukprot:scaffold5209_cov35-Cyclotella_meneghiniana.AAC.5